MANLLRTYVVQTISDDEKVQIIDDYEEFEAAGFIGDSVIRARAHAFLEANGISDTHITMWMRELAFECHRCFSMNYVRANHVRE